jgi:hypothetical protein
MRAAVVAIVVALSVAPAGAEDAYGIAMGDAASTLDVERALGGLQLLLSVPEPHPALDHYAIVAGENSGVCRVVGTSPSTALDSSGELVRATIAAFVAEISARLGEPEIIDTIADGSQWSGPEDWASAVWSGDRVYQLVWRPDGAPGGLAELFVTARADAYDATYFATLHIFANDAECLEEVAAQSAATQ